VIVAIGFAVFVGYLIRSRSKARAHAERARGQLATVREEHGSDDADQRT
jgi:hypothetical protein